MRLGPLTRFNTQAWVPANKINGQSSYRSCFPQKDSYIYVKESALWSWKVKWNANGECERKCLVQCFLWFGNSPAWPWTPYLFLLYLSISIVYKGEIIYDQMCLPYLEVHMIPGQPFFLFLETGQLLYLDGNVPWPWTETMALTSWKMAWVGSWTRWCLSPGLIGHVTWT